MVRAVEAIYERALADARAYAAAGFDGLIVENHGDIPFAKPDDIGPETAAHMAVACDRVRRETGLPIGVNVLANAALHALAVASACGRPLRPRQPVGQRLRRQRGLDRGRGGAGASRYRRALAAEGVRIFADAHVKHGAHAIVQDRPIAELVRDVEFFSADAVIATGQRTGHAADLDYIRTIRGGRDPAHARRQRRDARQCRATSWRSSMASSSRARSRSAADGGTRSTRRAPRRSSSERGARRERSALPAVRAKSLGYRIGWARI